MAISVVQTATTAGFTSTASFGSGVTSGNSIVLCGSAYVTGGSAPTPSANPTIGGSTPSGTSQLITHGETATNGVTTTIWLMPVTAGVAGSTALAYTYPTGQYAGLVAWEVAGLGSSPSVDQSVTNGGNSASVSSGNTGAITSSPEFIVGSALGYAIAVGTSSGYTSTDGSGSGYYENGYQIASSSGGTYSWSSSAGGSAAWTVVVVTIQVAASGPAAPQQPPFLYVMRRV